MIRRHLLLLVSVLALLGTGCATTPQTPVAQNPHFHGIYRLAYSGNGSALYYRFFPDGVVLSARSEAPAFDIAGLLTRDSDEASRGTWRARDGELRVGVDEGTVSYDSRFDLRDDGRIALRGLPRAFEFIPDSGTTLVRR